MTNNLPRYELFEKYNEEKQQGLQVQQEYAEKVTVAEALVKALEYRYNEAIKKAIAEGTDNRQELTKIKKEQSAAIADLEHAREIQKAARTVNSGTITLEDVKNGIQTYKEQFQKEYIEPDVEKLEQLKIEYLKQFILIQRRIKFFEDEARNAYFTVNPKAISLPYSVGIGTQQRVDKVCVTSDDLNSLQRGLVPNSVKGAIE
jgi:pyruvate-formate lyase